MVDFVNACVIMSNIQPVSPCYRVVMIEQSRDLKNSSTGIMNTSITVHYCNFKLEPCTLNKCRVDAKGNGVSFKHIKGGILSKEHLDQRSGKKYHD